MVNSCLLELLQNVAASNWGKHIIKWSSVSKTAWYSILILVVYLLTHSSGVVFVRRKVIHTCHTLIVCPSVSCSFWIYGLHPKSKKHSSTCITQLLILLHHLQKFCIFCKVSFNPQNKFGRMWAWIFWNAANKTVVLNATDKSHCISNTFSKNIIFLYAHNIRGHKIKMQNELNLRKGET